MSRKIFQISISVILILTFQGVFGQSPMYFSKAYCPEGIATNGGNILLTDSGYIVAGGYNDSINYSLRLYLMHIDSTGNIENISTYGNDTIKYYAGYSGSIIQINDSEFIWAAGKSNYIKDFVSLIKFDKILSKIWEVDFMCNNDTTYSYLDFFCFIQTFDQGFIMVGGIESNHFTTDLLLQKTDSLGNIQWRKQFVYYGVTTGWSVIQTPDHGFLVGGGAYTPYVKHTYQGLLIKTDSLGNEQWRRYPGSPDYDDSYCIVRNSPDGNYIVGTQLGYDPMISSAWDDAKIRLMKFNNNGSVLWDKQYGSKMPWNTTSQVYIHPNGDITSCGYYLSTDSFAVAKYATCGWILKTNNNGDSLWMREHYYYSGCESESYLYDLKPTPDGGYILVGTTDSSLSIPKSVWALKVDSLGCAMPGCQYVGMKEVIINKEELVVYPNPARDVIHLKIPEFAVANTKELRIFNASGQEVFRQELPPGDPQPTININHLPNGSYFLRIITPEISIAWSKMVIISK
jgi:hypothetical protein